MSSGGELKVVALRVLTAGVLVAGGSGVISHYMAGPGASVQGRVTRAARAASPAVTFPSLPALAAVPVDVTPDPTATPTVSAASTPAAPSAPATPARIADVSAPPCQATQLQTAERSVQMALGTALATFVVHQVQGTACSLTTSGAPWASALTGPQTTVRSVVVRSPSGAQTDGGLTPGSTDVVQLEVDTVASAAQSMTNAPAAAVAAALPLLSVPPSPTVSAPPLSTPAPALPAPKVAAPKVAAPKVAAPKVAPPTVKVPAVAAPSITIPRVVTPTVTVPGVGAIVAAVAKDGDPPATSPTTAPQPAPAPQQSSGPASYPSGARGYDISWPQCGSALPASPYAVAVVGINDGRSFTTNPCLSGEAGWAGADRQDYINVQSPTAVDGTDSNGPAGQCQAGDDSCLAYNYGYNAAADSLSVASDQGAGAQMIWLDVETVGNCSSSFPTGGAGYWSCNGSLNARTIQGALDAIRSAGRRGGVYSTSYQWGVITGGYNPSNGPIDEWLAGAQDQSSWCSSAHEFGDGVARVLQVYPPSQYDNDVAC
jgi:hypothetical protein